MLSTLTPLVVPGPNTCGVVGHSTEVGNGGVMTETRDLSEGELVILDNSFPHEVYNEGDKDRFVLMAEVWHPSLTATERLAMQTLFACKDRFTLLEKAERPWGVGKEELMAALQTGAIDDLAFWKDCCDAGAPTASAALPVAKKGAEKGAKKGTATSKAKRRKAKGKTSGGGGGGGFGK